MKNHGTVGKGLNILREVLAPFVLEKLMQIPEYAGNDLYWEEAVIPALSYAQQENLAAGTDFEERRDALDIAMVLDVLEYNWNNLFKLVFPKNARSWAKEVKQARIEWAHIGGTDFTDDAAFRALDTMSRLAGLVDEDAKNEILELTRTTRYGAAGGSTEAVNTAPGEEKQKKTGVMRRTPVKGLLPWRSVIEPHPDVAQGRYKNAEFAADLAQVARGEGAYEYRDPIEFFSRTYVTEGMKGLLTQALRRVGGLDGEPVIQLKTAFGGGKTHSMLALYHLFRGRSTLSGAPDVQKLVKGSGIGEAPVCRVAALVGTAMDPSKSRRPANLPGVTVNTLWGEMAYQLAVDAGEPALYDMIRESDRKGVSPGSETLKNLFDACGSCVILIDELVAYAKKLWQVDGLPAGTFDNLIAFVQEITEAARASHSSLVVASIPESSIEIGEGEGGKRALEAIEHTFGRMESIWKPVAAHEGFEIVRRRLFLACKDTRMRDEVCTAFSRMYQENSGDFPTESKEVAYLERMKGCYPIHPEVFDRLYEDWATIERFQRTRGVLRLMAAVIHKLWMAQDAGLLIMPGSINLDEANIRDELTRHLGDEWNPIVDREVDGRQSIPYLKDRETGRFGRVMAARRVARTIMMGSAPSDRTAALRGIEASRIRLGLVQPGENIATFNDALTTLQGSLSYLYSNPTGDRYWYDTRPTLRKTVEDRASQRTREEVDMEIERRLREIRRERPFGRIHICPESSLDVSDDMDVGLVILKHDQTYRSNQPEDPAIRAAEHILNTRGAAPRIYRNMLAFIAPDAGMLGALREEVKRFLAWKSIKEDSIDLNLDAAQNRETDNNLSRSNQIVDARIQESYSHLLVPYIDREVDLKRIIWDEISIRGGADPIVAKAARKMQQNEQLITHWAPSLLLMQLDNLLWRDREDIAIADLWKMLCTYCYLPRLAGYDVLAEAIRAGANAEDYFAYAEGKSDGRYLGLKMGQYPGAIERSGYVVKQVPALKQMAADAERKRPAGTAGPAYDPDGLGDPEEEPLQPKRQKPANRHFSMTATLDPTRVVRNISNLMDEVINHLIAVDGAKVEIKLLVEAAMPDGTPIPTVRTVTENCKTLRVDDFGFDG
jgi:predicted AAA+ superfamily ATPase